MNAKTRIAFFLFAMTCCIATRVEAIGPFTFSDLGDLPGGFSRSSPFDLSSYGKVTGSSDVSGVFNHAFLWSPTAANGATGSIQDLGTLPSSPSALPGSDGTGVNAFGQVVGGSASGIGHSAFLWQPTSANATTGLMLDLGALPGGAGDSLAYHINGSGQVVGESVTIGPSGLLKRAFLWTPSIPNSPVGLMVNLGALSASVSVSSARGINATGQIVGQSQTSGGGPHGFLWNPTSPNGATGSMFDLGDFPGGPDYSLARRVNSLGQIVGESNASTGTRAFLWNPTSPNGTTGGMINLGDLSGGTDQSSAYGIDSSGRVVGSSNSASGSSAFLWTPTSPNGGTGTMIDLNTVLSPSEQLNWRLEQAVAINDAGQIVAYGLFDADGPGPGGSVGHAVLLTPVPEPATVTIGLLGTVAALSMLRTRARTRRNLSSALRAT